MYYLKNQKKGFAVPNVVIIAAAMMVITGGLFFGGTTREPEVRKTHPSSEEILEHVLEEVRTQRKSKLPPHVFTFGSFSFDYPTEWEATAVHTSATSTATSTPHIPEVHFLFIDEQETRAELFCPSPYGLSEAEYAISQRSYFKDGARYEVFFGVGTSTLLSDLSDLMASSTAAAQDAGYEFPAAVLMRHSGESPEVLQNSCIVFAYRADERLQKTLEALYQSVR